LADPVAYEDTIVVPAVVADEVALNSAIPKSNDPVTTRLPVMTAEPV